MLRRYTIYRIECPDGRSYIGCTNGSVENRIRQHFLSAVDYYGSGPNPNSIGPALVRFGIEAIKYEALATTTSAQEAAELETRFIAECGTFFPDGYNLRRKSSVSRNVKGGVGKSLIVPRDIIRVKAKRPTEWPPQQCDASAQEAA